MPDYLSHAADILMIAASLGAAGYCLLLSRRLSRLTSFDKGIGGAIAVMSQQVDEMKAALSDAKAGSDGAGHHLQDLVRQAREISGELEMMIAACHDFAEEAMVVQAGARDAGGDPDAGASGAGAAEGQAPRPGDAAEGDGPVDGASAAAPQEDPVPLFGSRRGATAAPVFRRNAQV
jgi:hypothetical protein